MTSYHVYFAAKEGVPEEELLDQVHRFMGRQIDDNLAVAYRVLRMTDKASFEDLPDFHLIVDYNSEEERHRAFLQMKQCFRDEPHAPLMTMVSTFRVAFSTDTTKQLNPDPNG